VGSGGRRRGRAWQGGHRLVLIDEICSGTDPVEGAALAQAVLQHLVGSPTSRGGEGRGREACGGEDPTPVGAEPGKSLAAPTGNSLSVESDSLSDSLSVESDLPVGIVLPAAEGEWERARAGVEWRVRIAASTHYPAVRDMAARDARFRLAGVCVCVRARARVRVWACGCVRVYRSAVSLV
jgi:hypothetical protein